MEIPNLGLMGISFDDLKHSKSMRAHKFKSMFSCTFYLIYYVIHKKDTGNIHDKDIPDGKICPNTRKWADC
jgi:hypothetical protein